LQSLKLIYQNKTSILKEVLTDFISQHSFTAYIGIELEFYLLNSDLSVIQESKLVDSYIKELEQALLKFSLIKEIQKEQGRGQIEIKTHKTSNLTKLAEELTAAKLIITSLAKSKNLEASFASQPFLDDCGSALQLNISLYNNSQENLFIKTFNQANKILLNSIAGLLLSCNEMMIFYAPTPKDYLRFDPEINLNLHKKGKYPAPINLSWGEENRTTAIRIPAIKDGSLRNDQSRLEFRVPAADADIHLTIICSIIAINIGIKNQLAFDKLHIPESGIYGNAFDKQYQLQKLVNSYEVAKVNFYSENCYFKLNLLRML
jgi:glutamine synthetase